VPLGMTTSTVSVELVVEHIHVPCAIEINNINASQSIELLAILYMDNQPVDLQLWDSNFCPISLFRIDKYLEGGTKNIICSLLRMVVFIKQ